MGVTKAHEMGDTSSMLEDAVSSFEKELRGKVKGFGEYYLVVIGEYSREICDKVEEIYIAAGWLNAKCNTSTERGERSGLTALVLKR